MTIADDDDTSVNKHCILKLYSPGLDYINLIAFWPESTSSLTNLPNFVVNQAGQSYMLGSEYKPPNIELSWEWKRNRSKTLITQTHLEFRSNRLSLPVSSCEVTRPDRILGQSDNQTANLSKPPRVHRRNPTLWETS